MQMPDSFALAKAAVLTLAAIKEATEAFDRGETNAHDTLEAITEALAAHRATLDPRRDAA